MQPARSPLPELDALRQQTITTPVLGTVRCGLHETLFGFAQQALELATPVDYPALRRSPGTQATTQRTHLEIGIGLFRRHFLHHPLDTHLTLQARPEEGHRGTRITQQLLALGTVVVGEEGKAAGVQCLEQQHATMRLPLGIDRGQGHRIGFHRQLLGLHRLVEPAMEQRERLQRRQLLGQSVPGIIAAHVGKRSGHCRTP
ncbi:hypothetical protein D3C78_1153990 [compost metagenome]